jgi:hypothetical protein
MASGKALLLGGGIRISGPNATSGEEDPAVAWNETADQYLVVWADGRNQTSDGDIFGRLVGVDGKPVGPDFPISNTGFFGREFTPAVAWNGTANEYLVVWGDARLSWADIDVYGRRLRANGTPAGSDFLISGPGPGSTNNELTPVVAWNKTANQYLVVWVDATMTVPIGGDVYGRRVRANGTPVGENFLISGPTATSEETSPAVAWNGTANQYLVVWEDCRHCVGPTLHPDIYGRRVRANGTPVGDDLPISGPQATAKEEAPAVVWNGTANQYLVVWEDDRNYYTVSDQHRMWTDIYGRRVRANGTPVGDDFPISGPAATFDQEHPAVVWNGTANQYLVVWHDGRYVPPIWPVEGDDIYGRRVRANGSPVGVDAFRISSAAHDEQWPALAWGGSAGQYLVVWRDSRGTFPPSPRGYDIYGQRVAG